MSGRLLHQANEQRSSHTNTCTESPDPYVGVTQTCKCGLWEGGSSLL